MGLLQTVAPAVEPVSLSQAKAYLRVEVTDDDTLISTLITAAREYCENWTQRQFITATWLYVLDTWLLPFQDRAQMNVMGPIAWGYWAEIRLPKPRLQSISSITYVDLSGNVQTLSPTVYDVDIYDETARVRPAFQQFFPAHRLQTNAIKVTFVSGYGSAGSNVPAGIQQAILLLVGAYYENREPIKWEFDTVHRLLSPYLVSII